MELGTFADYTVRELGKFTDKQYKQVRWNSYKHLGMPYLTDPSLEG